MSRQFNLEAGMVPFPGYRLIRILGRGGFAEVWQAATPDGGLQALKFMSCDNGRAAAREIRTLQAVRQLYHHNLIQIHRVWGYENCIVIAMELADGSLADLLEAFQAEFHTPLVAEQACMYLAQAAAGLDFLNTRQHVIDGNPVAVQHCDVKPSNMLLCGDVVKLADFGLSALTRSEMQFRRRAGTLDYTAPEVFRGQISDWTDQYSLAVTYCELRGGRLPFPDASQRCERDYVRPVPDLSMLPSAEQPIIARALSVVPNERWPSCVAFVKELALYIV